MKKAVIDLGTNTFHLLIAEHTPERGWHVLLEDRAAVLLGRGGISDGLLADEAQERGVATLIGFMNQIADCGLHVGQVEAIATSAVRSARNRESFLDKVMLRTGLRIRIIDGQQEARLISQGVQLSGALDVADCALIMDIGGGSVEFILHRAGEVVWLQSFELGGQRLMDKFMRHDPMHIADANALDAYLEAALAPLWAACAIYNPKLLVGASGSFDTYREMWAQRHNRPHPEDETWGPLPVAFLQELRTSFMESDRMERLAMPGMAEMRVDMLVVATALVGLVLGQTGIKEARGSKFALKEGVLADLEMAFDNH